MKGSFSEESLNLYQSLLQGYAESSGYEGIYDFTRCVRPDGSTYGTKGKCTPPNKPIMGEAPGQSDSSGEELPSGVKKVSVSMGGYSVGINVNPNRSRFPGRRIGAASR